MDTPLLKYLERHHKKFRAILLIYISILLINKIIFGPIVIDAFVKTSHLYSGVLVFLSIFTFVCGLYGYIKSKRYACIYFLTFYSIEKYTGVIHDLSMMHQNYHMFSTIALKNFLVDVYLGVLLSIAILIIGTLLLYFDYFNEKVKKKSSRVAS